MTSWNGIGNAASHVSRILLAGAIASACALALPASTPAQDSPALTLEAPPAVQRERPDLSGFERLRFVTDSDYPPFNYLDEDGTLTGFNVDLARAICQELELQCEIETQAWDVLLQALEDDAADAVIASIGPGENVLAQADFTESYYHTPARFAARRDSDIDNVAPEALVGHRIGVVDATKHALFLRDFYTQAEIVAFEDPAAAREALRDGEIALLFGDGISLMFWINGTASQGCCEFRGGAYTESRYFGEGIGIAVRRGDRTMRAALDWGLDRVRLGGRFEELLLRYFPMSVF